MSISILAASQSWLITPNVGLMIWLLVVFAISLYILTKFVFPRIRTALDDRARSINDAIDSAQRTREEAESLLAEYRARLHEARGQAEDIVSRARQTAQSHEHEARENAQRAHRGGRRARLARNRGGHAPGASGTARRGRTAHRARRGEGHAQGA